MFKDLDILENIQKALVKLGFNEPTDIQRMAIPKIQEGLDIIGQAQTGTGKTFAFGIPLLEKIDIESNVVQGLILCPTRELANQVYKEILKLSSFLKQIRVTTISGGQSYERQLKDLRNNPHVIIGTPGRIIDHMNRQTLKFHNLKMLILDEADEMLKMGFQEDLEFILKTTPEERQTVLFSATIPPFIKTVAQKYQKNPIHLKVAQKTLTVDRIKQYYYECKSNSKKDLLLRILDLNNYQPLMIFCNTKAAVDELVSYLQAYNYNVDGLHGDLKQNVRDKVMASFRNNKIQILIATDVAARGIDVDGIEAIINYDIPQDDEVYVHRIGRTGRAGKSGVSITFISSRQRSKLRILEAFIKTKLEFKEIPTIDEIKSSQSSIQYQKIIDLCNNTKKDIHAKIINKILAEGFDLFEITNALIEATLPKKEYQYQEIEVEKVNKTKPIENRNNDRKNNSNRNDKKNYDNYSSKKYLYAHINIGKKELLRPQVLLSYLEKNANVKKEWVGNIIIRKSGTTMEITKEGFKKLSAIKNRTYQNTPISITEVKSLE